ncbi:hypothetical protein CDAR_244991, partial [Caerostris darwini]
MSVEMKSCKGGLLWLGSSGRGILFSTLAAKVGAWTLLCERIAQGPDPAHFPTLARGSRFTLSQSDVCQSSTHENNSPAEFLLFQLLVKNVVLQ